ncbi:MAG: ester cyclase [Aeromicrobium sp.]|nr:ester cyclase [Burkholderiales bacterium]
MNLLPFSVVRCVGFAAFAALTSLASMSMAADEMLLNPKVLIVDPSLSQAQAQVQILAARRYDSFWNSGDPALARAALAPNFMDRSLPPGRAQGIDGPLAAAIFVRAAIPDLRCDIDQMIVTGDRVVVHLRFYGTFAGRFKDIQGKGQKVDFIATDIYRIADGRIAENWHIEDNLTFLQQLGVVGG